MTPTLNKRLAVLEVQAKPTDQSPPMHPIQRLLDVLVAYHLGGMDQAESVAAGMARGMGYDNPADLRAALTAGDGTAKADDLNARWKDALRRLFALKGALLDCDSSTFGATLEALFLDLPDGLKRHPFLVESDGFPEAIYDHLL